MNPNMINVSDAELLRRHIAGDPAAFTELHGRHAKWVRNLFVSMSIAAELVDELVQETFFRIHKHALTYEETRAKFSSWIYLIAQRLAFNEYRNHKRRTNIMVPWPEADVEGGPMPVEFQDPNPTCRPDVSYDLEQRNLEASNRVASLPLHMRIVYVMRDVEGFKYQEIATQLQLKEGTVKSRLFRARQLLEYMNREDHAVVS